MKRHTALWLLAGVVLVCAVGFAIYNAYISDENDPSVNSADTQTIEERFTPESPNEEHEGEPYILDTTKPLDAVNLLQSPRIKNWDLNLEVLLLEISNENVLSVILISGNKVGDRAIEIVTSQDILLGETRVEDLEIGDILKIYIIWYDTKDLPKNLAPVMMRIRVLGNLEADPETLEKEIVTVPWQGSASGKVQEINGHILTLVWGDDALPFNVLIKEDASVDLNNIDMTAKTTIITEATFEDVRIGDRIMAHFYLSEDNEPEAYSIHITRIKN